MAITSQDALLAGCLAPIEFWKDGSTAEAIGVRHATTYQTGTPGTGATPAAGINGEALTTYVGQIPFTNPGGGSETRLAAMSVVLSVAGTVHLLDRLWQNSGITVTTTTAQSITSAALPARDKAGSTNGDGVMAAIEVRTATTNGSAVTNTTLNYTNQAGTAGRTATIASFPATAVAGTFVPFSLQAGDTGIRSVQGITLGTSYGGGAIHLVLYRQIAQIPCYTANVAYTMDAYELGFPKLYDNTVPFLVITPTATTSATLRGMLTYSQG